MADARADTSPPSVELERQLEQHRVELTGYCYRMLGSAFEAEDAVQETLVRAWRGFDRFEGRSSLRSWLYRIATNVCFDLLNGRRRRARPMDLGPVGSADASLGAPLPESAWVEPVPDGRVLPEEGDPAELAVARETIRLAFVAALQYLPAQQRAVLVLREVLRWRASEVAELLGTSVAAVNSALQRARATLGTAGLSTDAPPRVDDAQQAVVARYLDAFERYDVDALVALLHDDATHSMPPYDLWLRGPAEIRRWMLGPGIGCRGSRLVPVAANGAPAVGQYRRAGSGNGYEPFALHVLELSDGRIAALNFFLDTERLFPLFGLPPTPPE
ncbi:MAG TPA: sigma-70 family RNA polymerase sigma factor [Acidimicrobiia bacterium]